MAFKFKTPLISKLRSSGGTFYTVPSATEDIGLNINESTNKVSISHYALLNLPDTFKGNTSRNYFNFNTIADPTNENNPNAAIAESLENYMFNFETALRNQPSYDYSASKTVSERAFWKWLQKSGAMQLESYPTTRTSLTGEYYKEIESSTYDTVVVGYGKVAGSNYRSDESTIYNEVYVQVPSSYGKMPVFFKTYDDANYISVTGVDGSLQGQTKVIPGSDFRNEAFTDGNGYTVGEHENVELEWSTSNIGKLVGQNNITYDNLAIDSSLIKGTNYEFNTIVLFYTIYDSNNTAVATNLFGIMFLESTEAKGTDTFHFCIPRLQKKKSNYIDGNGNTVKGFGNGYSFRINLRTSAIYDDTAVEIEDYSTSGAEITNDFNTVIANLNNAISILRSNTVYNSALADKYNELNNEIINLMNLMDSRYSELSDKYNELLKRISNQ